MSLQAIIFDMDGVIIDSEGFWQDAQIEMLADQGVAITAAECEELTKGKRIDEIARVWCEKHFLTVEPQWLEKQIIARVCNAIRENGMAMNGLYQVLECFHRKGYRLALATSSSPEVIEAVFDKLDLWQWFGVICSADEESFGKPHPAVYLTAMRKLGLQAAQCRVIEDSLNGFTAARRAEIKTFVVAPDCHEPKFASAAGHYSTLTELSHALNLHSEPALRASC